MVDRVASSGRKRGFDTGSLEALRNSGVPSRVAMGGGPSALA
jgi:hypothetical protein